jgi:hypothetical protein
LIHPGSAAIVEAHSIVTELEEIGVSEVAFNRNREREREATDTFGFLAKEYNVTSGFEKKTECISYVR